MVAVLVGVMRTLTLPCSCRWKSLLELQFRMMSDVLGGEKKLGYDRYFVWVREGGGEWEIAGGGDYHRARCGG